MKQIFDWLREQNGKLIGEVHSPADVVWNNAVKMCITKIDEAEAKWESDCCEWKWHNAYRYADSCCEFGTDTHRINLLNFKYCPYCGKPIKIVEVE